MDLQEYFSIQEWLYHEAELLDRGQLDAWLDLLSPQIRYEMPVRSTRERGSSRDIDPVGRHMVEDRETLGLRVKRLATEFAWAEDPPTRTRRFICNVRVRPGASSDEVVVQSALLLYRNRGGRSENEFLAGERTDTLRKEGGRWVLWHRVMVPDQETLNVRNLAIFV